MTQDQESGAAARDFGLKTAELIAKKIGAKKTNPRANEFEWKGQKVTIRMAHEKTTDVGVLYSMLDRVQAVIAALEIIPSEYELFSLSPDVYRQHMRDSKKQGRVGLVRKRDFMNEGILVAKVNI